MNSFAWGGTKDLTILAFGDSITYGIGSSSGGPQTGYPLLLEEKLAATFPGNFICINAGLPGEVLSFAVERFEAAIDTYNPDLVLLMEGTNDLNGGVPFEDMENSLRTMVLYALNRGKKIIIGTIAPVTFSSDVQGAIEAFNPIIYQIAADYNIPVAGVFESMTAVEGWETQLIDPVTLEHPNDAGYQVVRDAFFEQVSYLINSGSLDIGNSFDSYDFNGDGQADILWQDSTTGQLDAWLMNGTSVISQSTLGGSNDLTWKIVSVADFNGDGRADILWQNSITGELYLWLMNGLSVISQGSLGGSIDSTWKVRSVADFNGDGRADILWQNSITGQLYLWLMNGLSVISQGVIGRFHRFNLES